MGHSGYPIRFKQAGQKDIEVHDWKGVHYILDHLIEPHPTFDETHLAGFLEQVLKLSRFRTLADKRALVERLIRDNSRKDRKAREIRMTRGIKLKDLLGSLQDKRKQTTYFDQHRGYKRSHTRKVPEDIRSWTYLSKTRPAKLYQEVLKTYPGVTPNELRFITILGTPLAIDGMSPEEIAEAMAEQAREIRMTLKKMETPYRLISYWDTEFHTMDGTKDHKDRYCASHGFTNQHGKLIVPHLHGIIVSNRPEEAASQIAGLFNRPYQIVATEIRTETKQKLDDGTIVLKTWTLKEILQRWTEYLFEEKSKKRPMSPHRRAFLKITDPIEINEEKTLRDDIMRALRVRRWTVRTGHLEWAKRDNFVVNSVMIEDDARLVGNPRECFMILTNRDAEFDGNNLLGLVSAETPLVTPQNRPVAMTGRSPPSDQWAKLPQARYRERLSLKNAA